MMVDYFDMVDALTTDYLNVFLAEPENDRAQIVRLEGYVTRGIDESPECFSYTKMLHAYAQVRVCDEDRGYVLKLLDPENVVRYFDSDVNRMEFIYRVVEDGKIHYYSAQVSRIRKKAGMSVMEELDDAVPGGVSADAGIAAGTGTVSGTGTDAVRAAQQKDPLHIVVGFRNVDVLISMMKKIGEEYPSSLLRYMQEYGR